MSPKIKPKNSPKAKAMAAMLPPPLPADAEAALAEAAAAAAAAAEKERADAELQIRPSFGARIAAAEPAQTGREDKKRTSTASQVRKRGLAPLIGASQQQLSDISATFPPSC
eukprot:5359179-Pleurochrysis_carterae.AAC.1